MINKNNNLYESNYNIKLKTFLIQCISLFFLIFIISFALNIFKFNMIRLILEIVLIIGIAIMFSMSYKTKKLKPYHYIILVLSNVFVVTLLLILDEMSKITVFSYFSIIVLFTVILFNKIERVIFIILEFILYTVIAIYLVYTKETSVLVYNMLIQIFISTCTIVACFLNVLKMYESNARNLKQLNSDLKENAQKDSLTNLWNREYMNNLLDNMTNNKNSFSIVMFDLDHFKKINDTYGHPVGDKALKKFAQLLSRSIPKNASAIRYGGEEFLVVLPDKNSKQAFEIADKIRNKVQTELKIKEIKGKITISGGVKEYDKDIDKATLIEEADKNLYLAKESGRNKIAV